MKRFSFTIVVWLAFLSVFSTAFAGSPPSQIKNRPILVELFTAQGCVNCPKANQFLDELSKDPNVITLSLAVDYWDYLGWRDTYATSEFSQRQKEYGEAVHSRRPFTPQIILDGKVSVRATRPSKVRKAIKELVKEQIAGPGISLVREGDNMRLDIAAGEAPAGGALILIADYLPGTEQVIVEAGENMGKILDQVNMVTRMREVGRWNGEAMTLLIPAVESGSCVAILQMPGPGKVLAATRLSG